jgi:hypothetical protein
MGYYYDADVKFDITEASQVALSLDLENLRTAFRNDPYAWKADGTFQSAATLLDDIQDYTGWELNDTSTEETRGYTVTRHTFYGNQKWGSGIDVLVRWLASHGVGIHITCRGEDGDLWGYSNQVASTKLREYRMTEVPADEEAILRNALKAVNDIRVTLDARTSYTHDELVAKISEAVATVPAALPA